MNGHTAKRLRKVARNMYMKNQLTEEEKDKIPWYKKVFNFFKSVFVWKGAPKPERNEGFKHYYRRVKEEWKNTPWNERCIKELKEGMKDE